MWAQIPGFSRYEVSDDGNVRSKTKFKRGRTMAQHDNGGYRYVGLVPDDGCRQVKVYVHRVVLASFVRAPLEGEQASHLNGDRADNRLSNLRWERARDNNSRKVEHGTLGAGEKMGTSKLTPQSVLEIRSRYALGGISQRALARQYGISQRQVLSIVKRRSWVNL